MSYSETRNLLGRMFGYRLDDGDSSGPLPILAEVLSAPRGMSLGDRAVWCRCYSEIEPAGEEGSVPVAWLVAELDPMPVPAMRHIFQDNPQAVPKLAERFPVVQFTRQFETVNE